MTTKQHRRDHRKSPRVDIARGIWVAWRTEGDPCVSRVRDLSVGGVFITTDAPLARGCEIHLLFSLPEGEIRIKGEVRYSSTGKGMGVQFKKMGASDRARLRELLRRLRS